MIPYQFHFVWMGKQFTFANRLAVESLLQTNSGARVTVHYEDPPANDDWDSLRTKIEMRPLDLDGLLAAFPESRTAVASILSGVSTRESVGKSNIFRYLILYKEGGVYLDFDTLTLKEFRPLLALPGFIGEESVFKCDEDWVAGRIRPEFIPLGILFRLSYHLSYLNCRFLGDCSPLNAVNRRLMRLWSIKKLNGAVLACEPGNAFIHKAINLIPQSDPRIRYALGTTLMNRVWEQHPDVRAAMTRLTSDRFFFVPPSQTYRFFHGPSPAIPENAYTLHWCSSNHRKLASTLTRESLERESGSPTLFGKVACEVIRKGL